MPFPDGRFFAVREPDGRLTLRDATSGRITRTVSDRRARRLGVRRIADGRMPRRRRAAEQGPRLGPAAATGPAGLFRRRRSVPTDWSSLPTGRRWSAVAGGRQVSVRDLATGRRRAIVVARSGAGRVVRLRVLPRRKPAGPPRRGPARRNDPRGGLAARDGREGEGLPRAADFPVHGLRPRRREPLPRRRPRCVGLAACNRPASSTPSSTIAQEVWAVADLARRPDRGVRRRRRRPADLGPGDRPRTRSRSRGHTATVSALAFRPDGRVIASGSLEPRATTSGSGTPRRAA